MNTTTILKRAVVNGTGATAVELVAAVTDKVIRVVGGIITADDPAIITIKSATTSLGAFHIANDGQLSLQYMPVGHFQTVAGEALNYQASADVDVDGYLLYEEIG